LTGSWFGFIIRIEPGALAPTNTQPTENYHDEKINSYCDDGFGLAGALSATAADAKEIGTRFAPSATARMARATPKWARNWVARIFTDAKVQADLKDDAAAKSIKDGLKSSDGKTLMKPFDALSDDEAKALVTYVRGLKK